MTRDELLAELLAERFGKPTPEHHNRNDGTLGEGQVPAQRSAE